MEVNHKQLVELLTKGFKTKVPIDIKGKPGIGKSELVEDTAKNLSKDCGRKFIFWNRATEEEKERLLEKAGDYFIYADLRLSQFDQTDLKGFPIAGETFAKWTPNLLFKVLSNPDAQGLIFFDEMNLAPPSVVASCYQIVNDHLIGESPISYGVYFVSAGNGVGDTNNAFDDPAPLNNRRMNVVLEPPIVFNESGDGGDWTTWAALNGVDARIISYLNWKTSMLFKYDPDSKDASFPSPRMWYKASKLITDIKDARTLQLYVGSCVGEAAARELVAFTKLTTKVDAKEIIRKPEKVKKILTDLDLLHNLVGQIAEIYRKDNDQLDQIMLVCQKGYLPPEFSMYMLRVMKSYAIADNKETFSKQILGCKNFKKIADEFRKYLL